MNSVPRDSWLKLDFGGKQFISGKGSFRFLGFDVGHSLTPGLDGLGSTRRRDIPARRHRAAAARRCGSAGGAANANSTRSELIEVSRLIDGAASASAIHDPGRPDIIMYRVPPGAYTGPAMISRLPLRDVLISNREQRGCYTDPGHHSAPSAILISERENQQEASFFGEI